MKARRLILTTATLAALATTAAQAAPGSNRLDHSERDAGPPWPPPRAAYVALANDGHYSVAIHTILAG